MGKLIWYNMIMLLPAATFRFQAALLAYELRMKVFRPSMYHLKCGGDLEDSSNEDVIVDAKVEDRLDLPIPSLELMIKAMTNTRCLECVQQER